MLRCFLYDALGLIRRQVHAASFSSLSSTTQFGCFIGSHRIGLDYLPGDLRAG